MADFVITQVHEWWAEARVNRWRLRYSYLIGLLESQEGKCKLSGVNLLFGAEHGAPIKGVQGSHPLYAVLDHCKPGSNSAGHQIICSALNHVKGHTPLFLFEALQETDAWQKLMRDWRNQADTDPYDRSAFYRLLDGQ